MEIPSFITEHPAIVIIALVVAGYAVYKLKDGVM